MIAATIAMAHIPAAAAATQSTAPRVAGAQPNKSRKLLVNQPLAPTKDLETQPTASLGKFLVELDERDLYRLAAAVPDDSAPVAKGRSLSYACKQCRDGYECCKGLLGCFATGCPSG